MKRFRIMLTTCDRPERLRALLSDLLREAEGHDVFVTVANDGKQVPKKIQQIIDQAGWGYRAFRHKFGKVGYGKFLSRLLVDELKAWRGAGCPKDALWMVLQDDYRLCKGFFRRLGDAWDEGRRHGAIILMYHIDRSRRLSHKPLGEFVNQVRWLDASIVTSSPFLSGVGWTICGHRAGPGRSSGVGNWLTARLRYDFPDAIAVQVKESIVVHATAPSVMNPDVYREPDAMRTVRYIDGDEARDRLEQ